MSRRLIILGLLLVSTLYADKSGAESTGPLLSVAVGHVGVFDHDIDDPEVLKLEYRFRPMRRWRLATTLGAARSGNGARFVFAGIERDFFIGERWAVVPTFGVGSFSDGIDVRLGHS